MIEEKYPFTFTPPVVRYLNEIITGFENRKQKNIRGVLPFSICLESYEKHELFHSDSEDNRKAFIEYLEKEKAVRFELIKITDTRTFDDFTGGKNKEGDFNTNFVLHILNMNPVHELWDNYMNSGN